MFHDDIHDLQGDQEHEVDPGFDLFALGDGVCLYVFYCAGVAVIGDGFLDIAHSILIVGVRSIFVIVEKLGKNRYICNCGKVGKNRN